MDPRHPEIAIDRMDQLMVQFKRVLDTLRTETIASKLGQAEREGSLVVQELCLVAPRLHEAMMQVSRERRHDLSHGVIVDMSKYKVPAGATGEEEGVVVGPTNQIIAVNEATTEEAEVVEKPVEKSLHRADIITEIEDPYKVEESKPKKNAAKKKTAKKKAE